MAISYSIDSVEITSIYPCDEDGQQLAPIFDEEGALVSDPEGTIRVAKITVSIQYDESEVISTRFPVFPLSEENLHMALVNVAYNKIRAQLGTPLEVLPELKASIEAVVSELDISGIVE